MKFRLIQDHTAMVNPWFRVEKLGEGGDWIRIDSGSDLDTMKLRMQNAVDGKPEFTVIKEAESAS
jgi:hypothetical protein